MEWITPKTNWKVSYDEVGNYTGDYLNIEDAERIKSNLKYLKTLAEQMYHVFSYEDMEEKKTYFDYPTPAEWNAIENNLHELVAKTFPTDIGDKKNYAENLPIPDDKELNRIESTMLYYYKILTAQQSGARKLSFVLDCGRW